MAPNANAAANTAEKLTERAVKAAEKIANTEIGVKLPAQEGDANAHLQFRYALIAIAVATLLIPLFYKCFLRSVYFAYKKDRQEKEDLDDDDDGETDVAHFRPWYSAIIPTSISLTAPFSGKAGDDDDSDSDDSDSAGRSPRKASPKKSSSPRARSKSPTPKKSGKKTR